MCTSVTDCKKTKNIFVITRHYTTTGQLAARGAIAGLKVWSQAQRKNVWDSGVDAWVDGRASRYG